MKYLTFIVLSCLLSGCSSLGDLQAWNSMGKNGQQVGQVLRTIDSSCKVLTGHGCDRQPPLNPGQIANVNRTQGQIQHLPYYYQSGNIPKIIAETDAVFKSIGQ